MRTIIYVFALILTAVPSLGAQSPWQEVAPNTSLRLISSDVVTAGGKTMIALQLAMPPDTWTYWRVPGETGIPIQLDFSSSSGLVSFTPVWPFPDREIKNGYLDYIYPGDFVLPIKVEVKNDAPLISLSLVMGICSDVCVPVSASLTLKPDFSARDAGNAIRISQAMAKTPVPWDKSPDPVKAIAYDNDKRELRVRLNETDFDFSSMIAATNDPSIIFGPPQKSQIEGIVVFPRLGRGDDIAGQRVTISFNTSSGPYELVQTAVPIEQFGS